MYNITGIMDEYRMRIKWRWLRYWKGCKKKKTIQNKNSKKNPQNLPVNPLNYHYIFTIPFHKLCKTPSCSDNHATVPNSLSLHSLLHLDCLADMYPSLYRPFYWWNYSTSSQSRFHPLRLRSTKCLHTLYHLTRSVLILCWSREGVT